MQSCLLLVWLGRLEAAPSQERTWTSTTGSTLAGTMVSATPTSVEIRRGDGRTVSVARNLLSAADNSHIQEMATPPAASPLPATPMLAGYDPAQSNFSAPWPDSAGYEGDAPITVIEESTTERRFIYESPHFRFQCNVVLRPSLLAKVATMFEACYQLHQAVPLNNRRTRSPQAAKLKARMVETQKQYFAAGGMQGTSGVYLGEADEFLVPLTSLGVKKVGSGYMFDYSGDFHTFYHEICHQLWADHDAHADIWMVEGFAEYMACAPYRNGRFSLSQQPKSALEYITAYGWKDQGGRALGKNFVMPHLEKLMGMPQQEFYQNGNTNYGYGQLLVYYFILLDGEGDAARFKNSIKATQDGKPPEEARKALLDGRTYQQLEEDVSAGLRKHGIKVSFG